MNQSKIGRRYGWHPSKPIGFLVPRRRSEGLTETELPQSVDLRSTFPDCYDQGQLGSCTANGIAGLIQHCLIKQQYKWQFTPSRLFIYYNERVIEGTVDSDAGANIFDGINSVNSQGVCPEVEADGTNPDWVWTYDDSTEYIPLVKTPKFQQQPPEQCYKDAVLHKALHTELVQLDRNDVLNTLAAGKPIVFGFSVYSSFEDQSTLDTGIMPVPQSNEQLLGGHCVAAVGYSLNTPMGTQGVKDWALIRNSWGTSIYGELKGYFWMPLDEIMCSANFSSDAHVIDLVGDKQSPSKQG